MGHLFKVIALTVALSAQSATANEYVIDVNGIVCQFCALGVTKKVAKLPFIDPTKYNKGVKVDVERQIVTIALRDGATLDKVMLFDAIEAGGYHPIDVFKLTPEGRSLALQ